MEKRIIFLSMVFVFIFSLPLPVRAQPIDLAPRVQGINILHSDTGGVTLELTTAEYKFSPVVVDGKLYQRLTAPGTTLTAEPGRSQIPVATTLLGAPAGAQVEYEILVDEFVALSGSFDLLPSPRPAPVSQELSPGLLEYTSNADLPGQSSRVLKGGPYPASPVHIGEDAWLRDQRIIRIDVYPFQYHAPTGALVWHKSIRVAVRFVGGEPFNRNDGGAGGNSPYEAVLRTSLGNYEIASAWRGIPQSEISPGYLETGESESQFLGPRLGISINSAGIYRLSYDDLSNAGIDPGTLDPTTFKMSNQGQDIGIYVHNSDGDEHTFSIGEYILFYGQAFTGDRLAARHANENEYWRTYSTQNPDGSYKSWKAQFTAAMVEKYTNANIYWLLFGGTPGPRMPTISAAPGGAATPDTYRSTVHAEKDIIWNTTHFVDENTWFWEKLQPETSTTGVYTATLPYPAGSGTASLRGEVVSIGNNSNASPDHHIQVFLNDPAHNQALVDETWDGQTRYPFEAQAPQSQLIDGDNQLDLRAIKTPNMLFEKLYFDWFEIEYDRQFRAVDNRITFSRDQAGTWEYHASGFTSADLVVLDITNPLAPKMITGYSYSSGEVAFEVTHGDDARYAAGAPRGVAQAALSGYDPPDFSNPADYIIITHRDFTSAAQRLADYRAAQGLSTLVVDIDDLYNEFNDGIYHPIAVKNFLSYAFNNWSNPPIYVLLVGDGHWNFQGSSYYDNMPIYMPPNLVWVDPWQGEVDSANLLANVVGNDPLADVLISRVPVNSNAELNVVVDKIIAYEASGMADWHNNFLFIADNKDQAGDFANISDGIIQKYLSLGFTADRIYLDHYLETDTCGTPAGGRKCPAATSDIVSNLNQSGALIANYVGHAGMNVWSGEQVFYTSDIQDLSNGGQLPVFLSLTCLDGYWIYPSAGSVPSRGPSLAEELLRTEGRGAVAAFSPTGLGVATGHDTLHQGFYNALVNGGVRELGLLTQAAKLSLYQTGYYDDLLHTYVVFGDPALQIPLQQQIFLPILSR